MSTSISLTVSPIRDREGRVVVLKFRPQAKVDPVRLLNGVAAVHNEDLTGDVAGHLGREEHRRVHDVVDLADADRA